MDDPGEMLEEAFVENPVMIDGTECVKFEIEERLEEVGVHDSTD